VVTAVIAALAPAQVAVAVALDAEAVAEGVQPVVVKRAVKLMMEYEIPEAEVTVKTDEAPTVETVFEVAVATTHVVV
jgi:hypothetical protein